ncbi:subtilisin-like protease SBT5.4 [Humulus lupulus]|uniref:subtilisin-like protease SBT5.4 n=1 Tax=Humulus lupulus TaxID=3486 RepID=UPI002B4157C0|nr:subtilisin-like protease SBT5.4 [Humulus lupulus]
MGHCVVSSLLLVSVLLLFSLFHSPTEAIQKPYIVYMGAHSHGPNPTSADLESATSSHYSLLGSYMGSEEKAKESMLYSYNRYINGFAAVFDEAEASEIAKHPNVLSVFESKPKKLHTTHTWDFLGLERNGVIPKSSIWKKARYGQNTIIGNLDTGSWPESKSFSDRGIGPIPSRWKGICQDDVKDGFRCNRKLIGARYFNKGYSTFLMLVNRTITPELNKTMHSPRDDGGHGSHTLSTAGGSFVPGANVFNNGNGTAKGGSPMARVAAYKVCWEGEMCFDADILAGFEAAIADGVNVLSVSLGGAIDEYFEDAIAIGSFHAVKNGIVVVASAGNSGPFPGSISNVAPWLITVAASTNDREFTALVTLGNKKQLKGQSLSSIPLPSSKLYPLISGAGAKLAKANASEALLCKPKTLDPKKVKGKILVCLRGDTARIEKGQQAALAGAVGMILANDLSSGNDVIADPHFLPSSHINYNDGNLVFSYINSTKFPLAKIAQATTVFDIKHSPSMAAFSSRGPSTIEPTILKPDITAPGVNIIAAYTEARGPTDVESDHRRVPFNILSGTSMSCPHVSGIVGLLRTLHPNWSSAAIKSAIMTSAKTRDGTKKPILDSTMEKATPFAYGAGHIQPNRAMHPGLVYDLNFDDYLNFLCARGYNATTLKLFAGKPYRCPKSFGLTNLNYPSISVPRVGLRPVTITRRVKNVGTPGTYKAFVRAPVGVSVYVKPAILKFSRVGEEKTFEIVLKAKIVGRPKDYVFGELKWSDGKHIVRSPISVKY